MPKPSVVAYSSVSSLWSSSKNCDQILQREFDDRQQHRWLERGGGEANTYLDVSVVQAKRPWLDPEGLEPEPSQSFDDDDALAGGAHLRDLLDVGARSYRVHKAVVPVVLGNEAISLFSMHCFTIVLYPTGSQLRAEGQRRRVSA